MEFTRIAPEGRQFIQAHREGGFTIAGVRHEGSVLVLPERTLPWPVRDLDAVTLESLAPITAAAATVDILVLGCGAAFGQPAADLRQALRSGHRHRGHGHPGRVPHLQRPARRGSPGRRGPDRALSAAPQKIPAIAWVRPATRSGAASSKSS